MLGLLDARHAMIIMILTLTSHHVQSAVLRCDLVTLICGRRLSTKNHRTCCTSSYREDDTVRLNAWLIITVGWYVTVMCVILSNSETIERSGLWKHSPKFSVNALDVRVRGDITCRMVPSRIAVR